MIKVKPASYLQRGRIFCVFMLLTVAVIVICITACHTKEKKQNVDLQKADTSDTQTNQKSKHASGMKEAFPGGDTIQQGCTLVQDQAEALLEEYHQQGTTKKRRRQIVVELKKLNQEWKQMDCQQVFGFMIPQIPTAP